MKLLTDISRYQEQKSIVTLGKFDGIHIGHSKLFEAMHAVKAKNMPSGKEMQSSISCVAVTFNRTPGSILYQNEQKSLFTMEEKQQIYEEKQVDYVLQIPLTKEFLSQEPQQFVRDYLVHGLRAEYIICGSDFRFGKDRKGDTAVLLNLGKKYGFDVEVVDKVCYHGMEVSSTYIRRQLQQGNLQQVNEMLGYPFFITGEVIHGNALGRTIGIPTINIIVPPQKCMLPNGVYATEVRVDQKKYKGMTNVGVKPTIGENYPLTVETYLLGFDGDLYGKLCTVEFTCFLRREKKFASVEELKKQIIRDVQMASDI